MLGIFDSHAHYDSNRFDEDRDELLSSMSSSGVAKIVNIGANVEGSEKSVLLSEKYDFFYASAGIHPEECGSITQEDIEKIRKISEHEKVVAIGEIGLDYHWPEPDSDIQKIWFRKQLELAVNINKPVVIHSREATKDTLDIVKEYYKDLPEGRRGIVHCFSGSAETAKTYIDMGFYIGVGGVVTFNNSAKLKEVVKEVSIDRIVVETDCPYLAPVPNRGKRNDSTMLEYVIETIAQIKNISYDEVREKTYKNACYIYGID